MTYMLRVYVPLWFLIRMNSSIKDGSRHLFEPIRRSRYLPIKYRNVVDHSVSRNAFFALPEIMLLGMMTDQRPHIRKDALNKIIQALEDAQHNGSGEMRYNFVPTIHFKAKDYVQMIGSSASDVSIAVPPVLRNVSSEELIAKLSDNN